MAHVAHEHGRSQSLLDGLRGIFAGWRRSLDQHREFEKTYTELSALSDRELADIGIGRSEIVRIAWDSARHA